MTTNKSGLELIATYSHNGYEARVYFSKPSKPPSSIARLVRDGELLGGYTVALLGPGYAHIEQHYTDNERTARRIALGCVHFACRINHSGGPRVAQLVRFQRKR